MTSGAADAAGAAALALLLVGEDPSQLRRTMVELCARFFAEGGGGPAGSGGCCFGNCTGIRLGGMGGVVGALALEVTAEAASADAAMLTPGPSSVLALALALEVTARSSAVVALAWEATPGPSSVLELALAWEVTPGPSQTATPGPSSGSCSG